MVSILPLLLLSNLSPNKTWESYFGFRVFTSGDAPEGDRYSEARKVEGLLLACIQKRKVVKRGCCTQGSSMKITLTAQD